MTARIATAIIGIPIVVYAVCAGNLWPLKIFLAAIGLLALLEFTNVSGKAIWAWVLAGGYLAALVIWVPAQASSPWILSLLVVPFLDLATKDLPRPIVVTAWILMPLLSAVSLRAVSLPETGHWGFQLEHNPLLLVFLCLWAGDSMAYFVGSLVGKHKLAPNISPRSE